MRALPKLTLCFLFWQAAVLLLLRITTTMALEFDPYSILGVSHHASLSEIKMAYKQLVKEWHPDKNKDPEAQDMFIKISKAYKCLSCEECRVSFDRYGETAQSDSQGFQGFQSFQGFQGSNGNFDPIFWTQDSTPAKHLVNYVKYINEVVPNSFKKPYLIKVTSESCFTCIHWEPIWKEIIQELEPQGVGFGVVDFAVEKTLVQYIGVLYAPQILGVINGKIVFFQGYSNKESFRWFVESMLPNTILEMVTDKDYLGFLDAWREKNKPSVLLFDKSSSRLLFKLSAFAHRDFVRFGDVNLSGSKRLMETYNINMMTSSMLVFKENKEKPADSLKSKVINKKTIDEFIYIHRFLLVPRLVKQKLFIELCPLKQQHQPHKYCVLLISGEDSVNTAFFDVASNKIKQEVKFTHVNQKRQQPFCDTLLRKDNLLPPQVIILERQSARGEVMYRTVAGGWNGSDEDKSRLQRQLTLLKGDPTLLDCNATLPELNDELTSIFSELVMDVYDYVLPYLHHLFSSWEEILHINYLILSFIIILSVLFYVMFLKFIRQIILLVLSLITSLVILVIKILFSLGRMLIHSLITSLPNNLFGWHQTDFKEDLN